MPSPRRARFAMFRRWSTHEGVTHCFEGRCRTGRWQRICCASLAMPSSLSEAHHAFFIIKCPCGCGEELLINLDARAGQAWRLYVRSHKGVNQVTLYPRFGGIPSARAILSFGAIEFFFFGARDGDDIDFDDGLLQVADDAVLALLTDQPTHFTEIADRLDIIPGDAQRACRRLVRHGRAHELAGRNRGLFVRTALCLDNFLL